MDTEIRLMRVGMNMEEATVVRWFKNEGDAFAKGDSLYEIETDKVSYVVDADAPGRLLQILVVEGGVARVGEVVARLG